MLKENVFSSHSDSLSASQSNVVVQAIKAELQAQFNDNTITDIIHILFQQAKTFACWNKPEVGTH